MWVSKINYISVISTILLLTALMFNITTVSAWDFNDNQISTNNYMDITTSNGGGYYVGFRCEGGGLNALHITTSTSNPYGQVTTVSGDSGTFYLADTGGRGYFDKVILMVAIKAPDSGEELSEDLKINIKAGGYRWTSSGIKDQPPLVEDIVYVKNSINRDFGLSSVTYGPQSWKPAGEADHPLMYGQSSSDEFYLFFVDTGVGVLGGNSEITGLTDNGMARIDYTIENYNGETIVFNVYGYALYADAVQDGIAWTNKIEGTPTDKNARTSPSGFIVLLGYSGSDSEFSGSDAINYGDSGRTSYSGSAGWTPSVGNLNITSEPAGAAVFIDNVRTGELTNASFKDLPAGDYSVRLELTDYNPVESEDIHVKGGYVSTRHFNLTPAFGLCTVLSDIRGAKIFIDEKETLCYANWTFDDVTAGNHTISIKTGDGRVFTKQAHIDQSNEVILFFEVSSGDQFVDKSYSGENETANIRDSTSEETTPFSVNMSVIPVETSVETLSGEDEGLTCFIFSLIAGIIGSDDSKSLAVSGETSEGKNMIENSAAAEGGEENNTADYYETEEDPNDKSVNIQPIQTGSVYVTSVPSDMPIYIDNFDSGYITPHLIYGLKEGIHKVKLKKQNFVSKSEEVTVPAGGIVVADFNLVRVEEYMIPISVNSRDIKGGSFAVNGELPYFDLPSEVEVGSFGSYLTYNDGYNYYSMSLPVLEGGESIVLKKTENIGTLSVISDPEGADIFIDGLNTGCKTPYVLDNIGNGYHKLKVVKKGHLPVEKEISFVSNDNQVDLSQNIVLEEISTGRLTVTSDPEGCMIYLRDFYTGQTTPYTFEYIPIGTYNVGIMFNRTIFKDRDVTVLEYEKFGDTGIDFQLDKTK